MQADPLLRTYVDAEQAEAHSRGLASISYIDHRLAYAFGQGAGLRHAAGRGALELKRLLPDMITQVRYSARAAADVRVGLAKDELPLTTKPLPTGPAGAGGVFTR